MRGTSALQVHHETARDARRGRYTQNDKNDKNTRKRALATPLDITQSRTAPKKKMSQRTSTGTDINMNHYAFF